MIRHCFSAFDTRTDDRVDSTTRRLHRSSAGIARSSLRVCMCDNNRFTAREESVDLPICDNDVPRTCASRSGQGRTRLPRVRELISAQRVLLSTCDSARRGLWLIDNRVRLCGLRFLRDFAPPGSDRNRSEPAAPREPSRLASQILLALIPFTPSCFLYRCVRR